MSLRGYTGMPDGYRAVGKHRYGVVLIGALIGLTAGGWLLAQWIGDTRATAIFRILMPVAWIVQCGYRLYVGPDRPVADADLESSPRLLRLTAILGLVLFTAVATVEIRSLFVPE